MPTFSPGVEKLLNRQLGVLLRLLDPFAQELSPMSSRSAALFVVSWLLESFIVARLRKADSWKTVALQCALANAITYVALVCLAVSFHR